MLTRRQWLSGSLALLVARFEVGCGSDDPKRNAVAGGGSQFDRWQALRDALAHSPDHLRARADAAVATKDPKVIFAFVRDSIATVPPIGQSESLETAVRFGVDNLLRSGSGTPRERAELLVSLLDRAGFTASVVTGQSDGPLFANGAAEKVYLRRIQLPFEPGATSTAPADAEEPVIVDPDGKDSSALFDKLRPFVAATATVNPPYIQGLSPVPLVKLDDGGSDVYLNPLLFDAEYGESYATGMVPAAAAATPRSVLVRLSATRSSAVATPVTLAEGTFGYDELAGARLRISPQPLLDLPSFLQAKPLDVNSFVTGFALLAADGTTKRFVQGSVISATGDVIETTSSGTSVSGVPQASGGDPTQVTEITASATALSAPMVELTVAPVDGSGTVVGGLPASSFVVEEDGERVAAVLRENGGAPRVLLLWDGTGSQPVLTDPIAQSISDAIFAGVPNATVQVAALDGAPVADGFTLTSASAVKTALLSTTGLSSPVYSGLLHALETVAPTLILLFSDGDVEASPSLASQCLAALGKCPIVCVGCLVGSTTAVSAPLQAIAEKSGGVFVDGADLGDMSAVSAKIIEVGATRSSRPYRLAYVSRGKAGTHTLRVQLGTPETTTDFTLAEDATASGASWSEFVGMHLHLEMDGEVVERTLAGLRPVALADGVDATEPIAAASRAVRDFFLSSTWITFEGGAPTLSAWLDDALGAAIGWKPVSDAIDAKDTPAAYAAAASAPMRPLPRSLLTHSPLPQPLESSGALVVAYSLRAAVHTTLPLSSRTSVDILPTTRFRAIGEDDGQVAFDHAMRSSLRLAIAESAMAKGSTAFYLANAPLVGFPPGGLLASELTAFPAAEREAMAELLNRYPYSHRIVAADGSTRAFWAIESSSGTALGILPDATGGAIEDCKQIVDVTNLLIDELSILVGVMDAGLANAFIVIAAIGKAAAISVAQAALSFTDPLINPSIWKLGETIVCSALSDVIGNPVPNIPGGGIASGASPWLKNAAGNAGAGLVCEPAAPCTPQAP